MLTCGLLSFTQVDIAIAPFLARLYIVEEHRGFKMAEVGPEFEKWFKACTERESMVKTSSDREHCESLDVVFPLALAERTCVHFQTPRSTPDTCPTLLSPRWPSRFEAKSPTLEHSFFPSLSFASMSMHVLLR